MDLATGDGASLKASITLVGKDSAKLIPLLVGGVEGWSLPTSFPNTNLRLGRQALAEEERTYAKTVNKD